MGGYTISELGSTAPIAKIVSHALKDPPFKLIEALQQPACGH
jgi:hypothetical protein